MNATSTTIHSTDELYEANSAAAAVRASSQFPLRISREGLTSADIHPIRLQRTDDRFSRLFLCREARSASEELVRKVATHREYRAELGDLSARGLGQLISRRGSERYTRCGRHILRPCDPLRPLLHEARRSWLARRRCEAQRRRRNDRRRSWCRQWHCKSCCTCRRWWGSSCSCCRRRCLRIPHSRCSHKGSTIGESHHRVSHDHVATCSRCWSSRWSDVAHERREEAREKI